MSTKPVADEKLTPDLRRTLKLLRGFGSIRYPTAKSRFFSIRFYVKGHLREESVKSTKLTDAVKLLKLRHSDVNENRYVSAEDSKLTFETMVEKLEAHYRRNRLKTAPMMTGVNGLKTSFEGYRALDIDDDAVERHVDARLKDGYANSTINRELTYLGEMFKMVGRKLIPAPPKIEKLSEAGNVRKGFFEREHLELVAQHMPEALADVARVAYITGWRVFDEILTRQWKHVTWDDRGVLRLEPGETKNGEGRNFQLIFDLREILERREKATKELERSSGRIIPHIFHHAVRINGSDVEVPGKPLTNRKWYYATWKAALEASGLDRIPHDFRRTAIRNLEMALVPRTVAMKMVGHKTESVYRRYAIADQRMMDIGSTQLETFLKDDEARAKGRLVKF